MNRQTLRNPVRNPIIQWIWALWALISLAWVSRTCAASLRMRSWPYQSFMDQRFSQMCKQPLKGQCRGCWRRINKTMSKKRCRPAVKRARSAGMLTDRDWPDMPKDILENSHIVAVTRCGNLADQGVRVWSDAIFNIERHNCAASFSTASYCSPKLFFVR